MTMTLTPTAIEAVHALVTRMEIAGTGGLRIAPGDDSQPGAPLALALVDGPEATDLAIDIDGARVFLEAAAAERLKGKHLDAHVEHGRVQFVLLQSPTCDPQVDGRPPA